MMQSTTVCLICGLIFLCLLCVASSAPLQTENEQRRNVAHENNHAEDRFRREAKRGDDSEEDSSEEK